MRRLTTVLALCGLVGCATLTRDSLDQAYGPADPARHDQAQAPAAGGVSPLVDAVEAGVQTVATDKMAI
ncbi:MAG TPA: hypothetical protein PK420_00050, partial [Rubrivivax sp.]|nr:hypothetical protein [Rubrivivax sp.]